MVTAHVERGPDPDGALGWGLGLAVHRRQAGIALAPGSYGWDGGLGTSWANDPGNRLAGVLLTNRAWSSPDPAGRDAGLLDLRGHRHALTSECFVHASASGGWPRAETLRCSKHSDGQTSANRAARLARSMATRSGRRRTA